MSHEETTGAGVAESSTGHMDGGGLVADTPGVSALTITADPVDSAVPLDGELKRVSEQNEREELVNNVIQPNPNVTGEILDDVLESALNDPRERMFLLKLEHEIEHMLNNPAKDRIELPTMSSYHRLIAHRAADHFKLAHMAINTAGTGGYDVRRAVVLIKTPESRMPKIRFLKPDDGSEAEPRQMMKIMSREDSRDGDKNNFLNGCTDAERDQAEADDIAEREKKYIQARARIFNEQPRPLDSDSYSFDEPDEFSEGSRGKVKSIIRDGSCAYDPAFDRRLVQPVNPMAGQFAGMHMMAGYRHPVGMGGMPMLHPGMRPAVPMPRFSPGQVVPPHMLSTPPLPLTDPSVMDASQNNALYQHWPTYMLYPQYLSMAPHMSDPRGPLAYASLETVIRAMNVLEHPQSDFEEAVNSGKVLKLSGLHLVRGHELESVILRVQRCGCSIVCPTPSMALAVFRTRDSAENTRKALQLGRVVLEVYSGHH